MFGVIPLELTGAAVSRRRPFANVVLILANVAFYLLSVFFGWNWQVGPGSSLASTLLYGFSHAGFWHLFFNMWALWVFGNPVNRRLGQAWYVAIYLTTVFVLGVLARVAFVGNVIGASGGVFAVVTIAMMLFPAGELAVGYFVAFPLSLLLGLVKRPRYGINWFLNGGVVRVRMIWCLLVIPCLEVWSLIWASISGQGSVWNLGHLLGMACGLVAVVLLPKRISMPSRVGLSVE